MRNCRNFGFRYLLILLSAGCLVSSVYGRELILFIDDSGSVKGFNWLKTQLQRVGETLFDNGDIDQISIVAIGEARAPTPLQIPAADALAAQLGGLTFNARYTRIAEALTAGFAALNPKQSDLVVILSDFRPDHDNTDSDMEHVAFNRDDYRDLEMTLGILTRQIGAGTNVRLILLGGGQGTSPGPASSRLHDLNTLHNVLERLSQDPSRCLAMSSGDCSGLNKFLSWAVAFKASKDAQQNLSYLDRTAEFESVLQTILSDWLGQPFASAKLQSTSSRRKHHLRTAIDLNDISNSFRRHLEQKLKPLEQDIDEFPRHIEFEVSSGRSNFSGTHFVVTLEGIGPGDYEATARLYWNGDDKEELLQTRTFLDTDESSLYFAFNDFLNRELITWVTEKVPAPERPARVELRYRGDLRPEEVAPGFEVRVTLPASDKLSLASDLPSNRYGLAKIAGVVTRDGYFFEIYDVDTDEKDPIYKVPMAKNFWKSGDQSVGQKILLPHHQITLRPAVGEDGATNLAYRASIYKDGFYYWDEHGVRVATVVVKRLPPGKFQLRAVPENADYLESWSDIRVNGDIELDVGVSTNEGTRFLKDKFKELYKTPGPLRLHSPLIQILFEGVTDVQQPNFSSLPVQTQENWRQSPYVFHVVNRLLYNNRGCINPTGELCSPQGLRRLIDLYDSFAQEEDVGSSRQEGNEPTSVDQRTIDYLVLLWKNVLAPTNRDLIDLRLFLDEHMLDLPTIAEEAKAFLLGELRSETFEPLKTSRVELRRLLCGRKMAWGNPCP